MAAVMLVMNLAPVSVYWPAGVEACYHMKAQTAAQGMTWAGPAPCCHLVPELYLIHSLHFSIMETQRWRC